VTEGVRPLAFELRDVVYRYDGVTALDGLSLQIEAGTRVALLGANGSGKSTLLRILDGLYEIEAGSLAVGGVQLTARSFDDESFEHDFRRRVALVFQNPDVQLFNPTVFDEVAFGPLHLGLPKKEIRDRVADTLDRMNITHLKDRSPHRLSGGEKKRVALASVLVLDPEIILLDEPTAALDPSSRCQVIDLIAGWGHAKTVVTATHDLDIVEDIADYSIVLERGRVAAEGIPSAILRDTELLARTSLVHAHRHLHMSGEAHSHPHRHRGHDH
jgi:cobalt/nickel transport system ATP-binding protein